LDALLPLIGPWLQCHLAAIETVPLQHQLSSHDQKSQAFADFPLPRVERQIVKFLDLSAAHANGVVMIRAVVQLVHNLGRVQRSAPQYLCVNKLLEHTVDAPEADVELLVGDVPANILGSEMPLLLIAEKRQHSHSRHSRPQPDTSQFLDNVDRHF
jgi:hypothetical protein